ncbi:MAG: WD40 repeat domain-containing serine/threonine-protein kinase [Ktedonobacteraceae bacterium]
MVPVECYCPHCGAACVASERLCQACGVSLRSTRPLADNASGFSSAFRLAQHLQTSQLFKGRYQVVRQVGVGGFGAVYEAKDTREQRQVAIKEIGLAGLNAQQVIEATNSFNREVQLLSSLQHSSIPRIYEQLTDTEHWYLVMDFIEGETLEEHLLRRDGGCLPLEQALRVGVQLCYVLDYLHSCQPAIIFRDIKPTNVILTPEQKLYLIDFGVARQYKQGKLKDTIAFGSPGYAAPEQYGRAQTTPQADLYSLGALLHQMVTGQDPSLNPFHFQPLRTSDRTLPIELEKLVAQLLDMDEASRPESADTVRRRLQAIASSPVVVRRNKTASPQVVVARPRMATSTQADAFSTLGVTVHMYRGHTSPVHALAWSPDGKSLASCDEQRMLHIWNAFQPARPVIFARQVGHSRLMTDLAWAPDGGCLATASEDHTVRLWAMSTQPRWWQKLEIFLGMRSSTYESHLSGVKALSWSPLGDKIASGEKEGKVHIWNAHTRAQVILYKEHIDEITDVAWSPDGERIASASLDHTVRVWEALTGKRLWFWHTRTRDSQSIPLALAWSPDGRYLAYGCSNSEVHVWDIMQKSLVYIYRRHYRGAVNALAWSPDGRRIASAGHDHTVQVWGALDGKDAFPYRSHQHRVLAVAWSPDGQHLASAGRDTVVHIWKAM